MRGPEIDPKTQDMLFLGGGGYGMDFLRGGG